MVGWSRETTHPICIYNSPCILYLSNRTCIRIQCLHLYPTFFSVQCLSVCDIIQVTVTVVQYPPQYLYPYPGIFLVHIHIRISIPVSISNICPCPMPGGPTERLKGACQVLYSAKVVFIPYRRVHHEYGTGLCCVGLCCGCLPRPLTVSLPKLILHYVTPSTVVPKKRFAVPGM